MSLARAEERVPRSTPADVAPDGRGASSVSVLRRILLVAVASVGIVALSALGVWQLERRVWKLDLIERVNARVHAAPVEAPGPADWAGVNPSGDAYRHVAVRGRFLDGRQTLVKAVTELGAGYWVVAPFQTTCGFTVLINRGFVLPGQAGPENLRAKPDGGETVVNGLLRVTEPGGGFLRHNDPAADRWYSRDVAAIAAARGIENAAPYFVDADASPDSAAPPVGGLTVISFPNNHLVYALTWFGLAAMLAGWLIYAATAEMSFRRR